MDNAVARRGLPCTHVQYGEATALLSVMGLIALAFDLVASDAAQQHAPHAVRQLAAAIGTAGLVRGQHGDLHATGPGIASLTSVEAAHQYKTGALFVAAVRIPASLVGMADADALALETYARNIGLAFQIADDVRDSTVRDSAGRDSTVRDSTVRNIASEDADKCTFVTHLGIEGARDKTGELLADALRALDGFGPRAEPLRLLAHYVRTLAQ
jgi:geranylgeranyl pyrophosphate synthase